MLKMIKKIVHQHDTYFCFQKIPICLLFTYKAKHTCTNFITFCKLCYKYECFLSDNRKILESLKRLHFQGDFQNYTHTLMKTKFLNYLSFGISKPFKTTHVKYMCAFLRRLFLLFIRGEKGAFLPYT